MTATASANTGAAGDYEPRAGSKRSSSALAGVPTSFSKRHSMGTGLPPPDALLSGTTAGGPTPSFDGMPSTQQLPGISAMSSTAGQSAGVQAAASMLSGGVAGAGGELRLARTLAVPLSSYEEQASEGTPIELVPNHRDNSVVAVSGPATMGIVSSLFSRWLFPLLRARAVRCVGIFRRASSGSVRILIIFSVSQVFCRLRM